MIYAIDTNIIYDIFLADPAWNAPMHSSRVTEASCADGFPT